MQQSILRNMRALCFLVLVMSLGSSLVFAAPVQLVTLQDASTTHPPTSGVFLHTSQGAYIDLPVFSEDELRIWPVENLVWMADTRPTAAIFLPFRVDNPRLTQRLPGLGIQFGYANCPHVGTVLTDSPAERAGVESGDEILAIGSQIFDCEQLLSGYNIGDSVEIFVRRDNANRRLQLTLGPALSQNVRYVQNSQRFVPEYGNGMFLYELTLDAPLDRGGIYCLEMGRPHRV